MYQSLEGFQSFHNSDSILSCFTNFSNSYLMIPNSTNGIITRDSLGRPIPGTPARVERLVDDRLILGAQTFLNEGAYQLSLKNQRDPIKDLQESYYAGIDVLTRLFPKITVGTAMSGVFVKPEAHLFQPYFAGDRNNPVIYPTPMLPKEYFCSHELIEDQTPEFKYYLSKDGTEENYNRFRVNYQNPTTAQKLIRLTVDEVKRRRTNLLYLDNISYRIKKYPSWETTCAYLSQLRNELYGEGIRLIINVSWYVGLHQRDQELADADLLASSVDGVTFEAGQVLYPGGSGKNIRDKPQELSQNRDIFQRMLERGLTVIFIPETRSLNLSGEAAAAWAMMIRSTGDKLFVSKAIQEAKPDWMFWPKRFGSPKGQAKIGADPNYSNKITAHRIFEHGKITLILESMEVKLEE